MVITGSSASMGVLDEDWVTFIQYLVKFTLPATFCTSKCAVSRALSIPPMILTAFLLVPGRSANRSAVREAKSEFGSQPKKASATDAELVLIASTTTSTEVTRQYLYMVYISVVNRGLFAKNSTSPILIVNGPEIGSAVVVPLLWSATEYSLGMGGALLGPAYWV